MDTTALPAPLDTYFSAASGGEEDAVIDCFTERAVVVDDGHVHLGRDAIRSWHRREASAWSFTSELTATEPVGSTGHHVVLHLEGNFPGGVVDLHHQFLLAEGRILALTIAP